MRFRVAVFAWLVLIWIAFWRDLSVANLVSGTTAAAAVLWLFPLSSERSSLTFRTIPMVRFVLRSVWSIIRANLVVAWEVVTPSNQINEAVVAVELASTHPVVITLVSHAIILAPGTMVIDIEIGDDTRPTQIYVHVLHFRTVDEVRAEVLALEALALAAVSGAAESPGEGHPTERSSK